MTGKSRKPRREAPQFTSESSEWFTPEVYIQAAREFMDGIEVDPATCPEANAIIDADITFTKAESGLTRDWSAWPMGIRSPSSLWLNPPSPVRPWWEKLVAEYKADHVARFCYLAFNIAQLQLMQRWTPDLHGMSRDVCLCIPDHRIEFLTFAKDALASIERAITNTPRPTPKMLRTRDELRDKDPRALVRCGSPTRENAFIGIGDPVRFRRAFSRFGAVK